MANDEDNGRPPNSKTETAARLPPGVIVGLPLLSLAEAGAWIIEHVLRPLPRGRTDAFPFTLLKEAAMTLRTALARGELVATGINAETGAEKAIPPLFWERARVVVAPFPPKWPGGRATRDNGQEPWRDIRIDRRQLEREWPDVPGPMQEAPPPVEAAERRADPVGTSQSALGMGGHRRLDLPLVYEMRELIVTDQASGPWEAADKVADKAKGSRNRDSRIKRLVGLYGKVYQD